ncbi:MAG: hypothetical protein P1U34_03430 [Coxiellaceae bacterium]|nr:hypothetical protein [Coxiellaceae bacterium]
MRRGATKPYNPALYTKAENAVALTLWTMAQSAPAPGHHPGGTPTYRPKPSILCHTGTPAPAGIAGMFAARAPSAREAAAAPHITGVSFHRGSNRWSVNIRHSGNRFNLGYFDDQLAAGQHLLDILTIVQGTNKHGSKNALGYAATISERTTINHAKLDRQITTLQHDLEAARATFPAATFRR